MLINYRILQRTHTSVKVVAEIRDGIFSGPSADVVRQELEYWGYPAILLEDALYYYRFANSTFIGFERLPPGNNDP